MFVTAMMITAGALLVVALLLSLYRLAKGPTALDRAVGVDVFASSIVGSVAVVIAARNRSDLAALLIVFVLTAFFSTVSVARFMSSGRGRKPRRRVTPTVEIEAVAESEPTAGAVEVRRGDADSSTGAKTTAEGTSDSEREVRPDA